MENVEFEPLEGKSALVVKVEDGRAGAHSDSKVAMSRVAAIRAFFNMDTTRPIEPREIMTLKPEERLEIGDMCLAALGATLLEGVTH